MPGPGAHRTDQALADYLASIVASITVTAAANSGTLGSGVYDSLSGGTLQFRDVAAGSGKVTVALDGNHNILVDVVTGTTSATVCAGNDSRLSDARTPLGHGSTHLLGGADPITGLEFPAVCSQPDSDQTVFANSTAIVSGDPLVVAPGFMVSLSSGSLAVLDPRDGSQEFEQANSRPAESIILYGGNLSKLFESPLTLDSGILVALDSGSLADLDPGKDDLYNGFVNSRPGRDVVVPDFCASSPGGPLVVDAGLLYSLAGTGGALCSIL